LRCKAAVARSRKPILMVSLILDVPKVLHTPKTVGNPSCSIGLCLICPEECRSEASSRPKLITHQPWSMINAVPYNRPRPGHLSPNHPSELQPQSANASLTFLSLYSHSLLVGPRTSISASLDDTMVERNCIHLLSAKKSRSESTELRVLPIPPES
jgi:hypothetical protein